MHKELKITLGADPEFALVNSAGNVVSAHDIVPGTKSKPHKLKNCSLQADGTAVEFNITPASSADEFAGNIEAALKELREVIPKKYSFKFTASHRYGKEEWDKLPDLCKRIGCDPDWVASQAAGLDQLWRPRRRMPIQRPPTSTLCGYGGHIHVGWTKDQDCASETHLFDCSVMSVILDSTIGLVGNFLEDDIHARRAMGYGQSRVFRPKPYGVEYRTLPGTWLKYPGLWPWFYDMTVYATNKVLTGLPTQNLESVAVWFKYGRDYRLIFDDVTSCNAILKNRLGSDDFPKLPNDAFIEGPAL